jgi:hypothetical protein
MANGRRIAACAVCSEVRSLVGRGLCTRCYQKAKRDGTPLPPRLPRTRSTEACMVDGCKRVARLAAPRGELRLCSEHWHQKMAPECAVTGCDRKVASSIRTLCRRHLIRERRGDPLTKIRHRAPDGSTLTRDELGRKLCCGCDEWKPESTYGSYFRSPDSLNQYCKPCARDQAFFSRWGITAKQRRALVDAQGGRCKICGTHESELSRALFLDHDHAHCGDKYGCSECLRGLLCSDCNAAIGLMNDSPELLIVAAEYIRGARSGAAAA